jgi:catechol 2,3-dioxygenase-like lactoylglutathione lyase family enzyme
MTETNLFNGIEHVTIAAKDPKGLARWYCSTFGFKIAYESTRSLTTYVKLGESLLEIIEAGDADRVSHGERDPGFRHMAISVTDINKAYKNLSSRGVAIKSEPREKEGVWTAFLEDPEHNLLHLIQRSKPL